MTDLFGNWMRLQEQTLHANQTAFNAVFKMMGSGVSYDGAAQAAKDIGEAQAKVWDAWVNILGSHK